MKQSLIDITPKMGVRTPVYPGDPPFVVRLQTIAAVKALMDGKALPSRVLIKTRRSQPPVWSSDFRALSPECVEAFLAEGVELVGVDVPSIDPADSEELLAHRIALSRGLTVMENLDLSAVMAGSYELIALPLPLEGVEASPVRAVLRSIP